MSKIEERFCFYKIETDNSQNNFILFDTKKGIIDLNISMITAFDIVKDREPYQLYALSSDSNNSMEEIKKIGLRSINSYMIDNQKTVFQTFKKIILLEKINVRGITYSPLEKHVLEIKGKKYFNKNLFRCKYKFEKKKQYKFPHLQYLMENILQEGYEKFIELLAWKKQFPTVQIPCHWVIQDDGGTGKTEILLNFIIENLFPINIVGQTELESAFNNYMSDCLFVAFEEVEGYSDEKKLKALTGAKTLMINGKFDKVYKIQNNATIIINSNELKAIKIGIHDRRFNIIGGGKRLSPKKKNDWKETLFGSEEQNKIFFKGFHENLEKELQDLNSYLLQLKVDRVKIQIPLDTKKKNELIDINLTSELQFLQELNEEKLDALIDDYSSRGIKYFVENNILKKEDETYIVKSGFYELYVNYCQKNNLMKISTNHFFRRLNSSTIFKKYFLSENSIKHNGRSKRVLLIKNKPLHSYDEANSLEVQEIKI